MDLISVLEKTVSPVTAELEEAQRFLEQFGQSDLTEFCKQLGDVLRHEGKNPVVRMQAGLQLKNALYSKDSTIREQYQQRWLQFPEPVRTHIKTCVLETLGTETTRPSSAAQCVAYIACAELPHRLWQELMPRLTSIVTNQNSTELIKVATLEAIGYICQDMQEPDILQSQADAIITAIVVHGMKKEEPSNHVRLAATKALYNSLEFTKANFEKETERNLIMKVVCEATQSQDTRVKMAALKCLVKIMSMYNQYMEPYMRPVLFAITMEAMKSDVDEIALQGKEFWSNVRDERLDMAKEASNRTRQSRRVSISPVQVLEDILPSSSLCYVDSSDDLGNIHLNQNNEDMGMESTIGSLRSPSQSPPPVDDIKCLSFHRTNLMEEMICAFKDPNIINVKMSVHFTNEQGVDQGGVSRGAYSLFWMDFLEKRCWGHDKRVPKMTSGYKQSEWQSIGRIIVKGYRDFCFFPIQLNTVFLVCAIFGEGIIDGGLLLDGLMAFVAQNHKDVLRKALNGEIMDEDDNDKMSDFLSAVKWNNRQLPTDTSVVNNMLTQVAHKLLIEVPNYPLVCMSNVLKPELSTTFQNKDAFLNMLASREPTTEEVIK